MRMTEAFQWPQPFPPAWADDWGEDRQGLYAGFSVGTVQQRCRWLPSGTFRMGSPLDEPERNEAETQHMVQLTQGYWLADTACTQALWQAVLGENPAEFKDDPENPVEQVSWDNTQVFFEALNRLVPGLNAGLPTEAQWEYACRAGTTTPFSFGDTITTAQANYNGYHPYVDGKREEYREQTVPVKAFPANPWGLYQMHGNVWEWCQDWFADYPAEESVEDPSGPATGELRVLRGGSWSFNAWFLRSASRFWYGPGARFDDVGFRLAPGQGQ